MTAPTSSTPSLSYRDAGVDIDAGDSLVERIKPHAKRTLRPEVLGGIGGFGALMELPKNYKEPVLISGTDGVGTKLKLAFQMDKHDTIGQDLVAMSVNDILVQGAEPLFFLDYFACGHLDVDVGEAVVSGIARGCELSGCALIGGETAEMPGMYPAGEYDLAGFAVGVAEKSRLISGADIKPGDVVLGLGSSGPHSNGYSLVRKIVFEEQGLKVGDRPPGLDGTVGEVLLTPTRIYVEAVLNVQRDYELMGAAHITGGGILENLPRVLPGGVRAVLNKGSWPVPPVFTWLQELGGLSEREMTRTFNAGLGMILIVPGKQGQDVVQRLTALGEQAFIVGEVLGRKQNQPPVEIAA